MENEHANHAQDSNDDVGVGAFVTAQEPPRVVMDFSLIFFSGDGTTGRSDKYSLLLECAKFADENGFSAVITPERHFQPIGGLFPNPAVLSAALAMVTKNVQLRSGSVILPLHNPIRVAEEWSVVDNLSGGRVALTCATGWHPADFIIAPSAYEDRRRIADESLDQIRRLWRGDTVLCPDVSGKEVEVTVLPRPLQPELPVFLATSGTIDTWRAAGKKGFNVLCSLANHTLASLKDNVQAYRDERAKAGLAPEAGVVSTMLHTFVGKDNKEVKQIVREPLREFLTTYLKQAQRSDLQGAMDTNPEQLIAYAFEKHFSQTSLLGSEAKCRRMIEGLSDAGVNEVACFIDFGVSKEQVLAGLEPLNALRKQFSRSNTDRTIAA